MAKATDQQTDAPVPAPVAVSSTSSLDSIGGTQQHDTTNNDKTHPASISLSSFPSALGRVSIQQHQQPHSRGPKEHPIPIRTIACHVPTNQPAEIQSNAFAASLASRPTTLHLAPAQTIPVPIMPAQLTLTTPTAPGSTSASNSNTVPEFLYQLTKMLTDNNREVIEWSNARIEVHNPHKLATDVLHKYFRHSKFASFQRQLNYFGFRKHAGKGKMAPCSYVNDAATSDLRSLLLIKRKTSTTPAKEKNPKKRERSGSQSEPTTTVESAPPVNPVLAGILQRSTTAPEPKKPKTPLPPVTKVPVGKGVKHHLNGYLQQKSPRGSNGGSHTALAQTAVGKGVRHNFTVQATSAANRFGANRLTMPVVPLAPNNATVATALKETSNGSASDALSSITSAPFTFQEPHQLGMDIQSSLSELSNNFHNSLKDARPDVPKEGEGRGPVLGLLSRDSSLIDLAMIHPVEASSGDDRSDGSGGIMPFVDFPHDLNPTTNSSGSNG